MTMEHDAQLVLTTHDSSLSEKEICARQHDSGIEVVAVNLAMEKEFRKSLFNVRELSRPVRNVFPRIIEELGSRPDVAALEWRRLD